MNEQLQRTIELLQDGLSGVDADTAAEAASSWSAALADVPGAEDLSNQLAGLQAALEEGDLQAAADLLPGIGDAVQALVTEAPEADQDGLSQLATLLQG